MTVPAPAVIAGELRGAHEALAAAERLAANSLNRPAVSSAYYAIFHGARAAVWSRGRTAKTHRGLIRLFTSLFVNTGEAEPEYRDILTYGHDQRQLADYELTQFELDANEVRALVGDARRFVERMEQLVNRPAGRVGK